MNDSEKKDKILTFLNLEANRDAFFPSNDLNELVFKASPLTDADLRYLVESIIKDFDNGNVYAFRYDSLMTPFLESGGYVGRDARKKKDEELQEITNRKDKWEGRLAKWQVILLWIITPLTLIGSILGIIAFFRK